MPSKTTTFLTLLTILALSLAACNGPENARPDTPIETNGSTVPTEATNAPLITTSENTSTEVDHSTEEHVHTDNEETPTETAVSTNGLDSDYLGSYTINDTGFGTQVNVIVDPQAKTRTIESNALPNHETGEFPNPGNPNTISEQDKSWTFTTEPTFTGVATSAREPGVAINGVKFEPGTAERATCATGEVYSIEAIQDVTSLGLDFNLAHVQPTGEYHYHGVSDLLVNAYNADQDLVHVAFAADGYLIYYSKSGAYQSSYQLSETPREGTNCTYTAGGPNGTTITFGSQKDGALQSDWAYNPNNGQLDECNGITVDGQYIYLITTDYPYIPRCLMGSFAESGPGGGGQGGPPQGGQDGPPQGGQDGPPQGGQDGPPQGGQGGAPDFAAAAATLGISENDLRNALGGPPPNFEAAAATLGISVEALQDALGDPP